jgi:hypothetical protein
MQNDEAKVLARFPGWSKHLLYAGEYRGILPGGFRGIARRMGLNDYYWHIYGDWKNCEGHEETLAGALTRAEMVLKSLRSPMEDFEATQW